MIKTSAMKTFFVDRENTKKNVQEKEGWNIISKWFQTFHNKTGFLFLLK